MQKQLLIFSFVLLLFGCKQKAANQDELQSDSLLSISYAKGFTVEYFNDYKRITVINPWENKSIYARYYLISNKEIVTPSDGQRIKTPLTSIGAASGTHFEFLHLIDELNSISGICSPAKVYNKDILNKFNNNKLVDMGDPFSLNIERVQMLQPDAVMVSGFNQEDPASKRLIETGIPVLYNNEWMETSLLARAEWIKFVAAFYNKEKIADSIFNEIADNYQHNKEKVKELKEIPSVMVGGNFKGTWYMPGGNSYMSKLIADAGGSYYYSNDTLSGSLPLNFEVVLCNFRNAAIWIASSAKSIDKLVAIDERHGLFNAAKNKQVYNFEKRITSTGGNDFWESGIAHPDIILADMIKTFHPELMEHHDFVYVDKLK